MNPFEDWNNSELADALEENEEFMEQVLGHLTEDELEELELWQWDRSDLIDYAYQYIERPEEEDE